MEGDIELEMLASDSLGVRSMAASIKTRDISIVIDPGAALGPLRFGLPPAKQELEALDSLSTQITRKTAEADTIVISHYHYDHYSPIPAIFEGKTLFMKDTASNINASQKDRGKNLLSLVEGKAECTVSDGGSFDTGSTSLLFSKPVPHGPRGTRLGYVIMTAISRGRDTVIHTSDIEGMLDEDAEKWIIDQQPSLVIVDGPPAYLVGYKFSRSNMEKSLATLSRLSSRLDCDMVIDHHLLRSGKYREAMPMLFESDRIFTFAGYMGVEERLLEANRRFLHKGQNSAAPPGKKEVEK